MSDTQHEGITATYLSLIGPRREPVYVVAAQYSHFARYCRKLGCGRMATAQKVFADPNKTRVFLWVQFEQELPRASVHGAKGPHDATVRIVSDKDGGADFASNVRRVERVERVARQLGYSVEHVSIDARDT